MVCTRSTTRSPCSYDPRHGVRHLTGRQTDARAHHGHKDSLPVRPPIETARRPPDTGVVGNHETLRPLAEFYGHEFIHIPITADTKPEAEAELWSIIKDRDVELVVLARYMQILSEDMCLKLAGNAINIHHSFLPSFKGARPYQQAHMRGVKLIGATALCDARSGRGPIIQQDVVRVADEDGDELMSKGAESSARSCRVRFVGMRASRDDERQRTVIFN